MAELQQELRDLELFLQMRRRCETSGVAEEMRNAHLLAGSRDRCKLNSFEEVYIYMIIYVDIYVDIYIYMCVYISKQCTWSSIDLASQSVLFILSLLLSRSRSVSAGAGGEMRAAFAAVFFEVLNFLPLSNVTKVLRDHIETTPGASSEPDLLKAQDIRNKKCIKKYMIYNIYRNVFRNVLHELDGGGCGPRRLPLHGTGAGRHDVLQSPGFAGHPAQGDPLGV